MKIEPTTATATLKKAAAVAIMFASEQVVPFQIVSTVQPSTRRKEIRA